MHSPLFRVSIRSLLITIVLLAAALFTGTAGAQRRGGQLPPGSHPPPFTVIVNPQVPQQYDAKGNVHQIGDEISAPCAIGQCGRETPRIPATP